MREIKVSLPLINNLSVNHYLIKSKRGVFKRKEVAQWQDSLGWLVKPSHLEDWELPLSITCDLIQNDRRTRDISNFSKVICDAIEAVCKVDDTNYRWHDGDVFIRHDEEPTILITIKESSEKNAA